MRKELVKDIGHKVSVINIEEIKRTKAFKSMDKFHQNFIERNKSLVASIHHGFNVSRHLGYAGWERQTDASYQVKKIVEELTETRI